MPAIQAFQIALRAEPGDSLTWSRLGEVYSKAGRHAAAIKALHRALELDPQNWLCSFLIGEIKNETGLFQDAISIFNELLAHRPHDLSILSALARAHLYLGRTESQGGYHIRAEASFFRAISVALSIVENHSGFRGLAWKVISDAALQLCRRPVLQDKVRANEISGTLKSLLSTENGGALDLPSLAEFEPSNSLVFLVISIHACNLRLALNAPASIIRGSAWYDLAVGLQLWCNHDAAPKPKVEKKIVEAITNALKEYPSNDLYWNAYGNAHFLGHPKIAQHAYIKALELSSKVGASRRSQHYHLIRAFPQNVVTWTNLGLLYYHHGDLELANEALYRAQVTDPDYSLAWLGQALVATANKHDLEAQTVLTHATTLTSSLVSFIVTLNSNQPLNSAVLA